MPFYTCKKSILDEVGLTRTAIRARTTSTFGMAKCLERIPIRRQRSTTHSRTQNASNFGKSRTRVMSEVFRLYSPGCSTQCRDFDSVMDNQKNVRKKWVLEAAGCFAARSYGWCRRHSVDLFAQHSNLQVCPQNSKFYWRSWILEK